MSITPDHGRYPAGTPGELLDARCSELDPVLHGFAGALAELRMVEYGRYEVRQIAPATGNRLFVFVTASEERARAVFETVVRGDSQALPPVRGT